MVLGALLLVIAAAAQGPDSTAILLETDGLPTMPRNVRTAPAHLLHVEASGLYDMSTVYNELVRGLLRTGTIARDLRKRSQDALNGDNRAGYAIEGGITYAWGDSLFGHGGWRPRFALMHHDVMGLRFTDDTYALTFFGNAAYEDRTAHVGPSAFNLTRYQTLGFGVEDIRSGSFLQLSVVNGSLLNEGDIDRADLYTATDGRFLDLDIQGEYWRSDSANSNYFRTNGIGAAVSGQWNFFPALFGHRAVVGIRLDDAGFVAWNDRSLRVKKDSVVHYEGIRVENIIDLDGALIGGDELQDSLGFGYTRGGYLRPLPARLGARLRLFSNDLKWSYDVALDQRYLPGYTPHATVGAMRRFACFALSVEGGYGGFGGLRGGLGVDVVIARRWLLTVRSSNVVGTASESARGTALFLGLDLRW
jgi:hypothetical protein